MTNRIYLDANATAALRPEALAIARDLLERDAMIRNASSVHAAGRTARKIISDSRAAVRELLTLGRVGGGELIFTSGGTESCNALMRGFIQAPAEHIVVSGIEHPAILESARALQREGHSLTVVDVEANGIMDVERFVSVVTERTAVVSLMTANNETGAIQPIVEVARALRIRGFAGAIISDFTQAVAKSTISASELFEAGVDAIAATGHKVGALRGVGCLLFQASDTRCRSFVPLLNGGPQESRFRAGTENVMAIASFGAVAKALLPMLSAEIARISALREQLWSGISDALSGVVRLTPQDLPQSVRALSNTLMLEFDSCRGDDLVVALDLQGLAASSGSACQSGKQQVSHVMTSMGRRGDAARNVVRLSLDWNATNEQIVQAINIITSTVARMRASETRAA